MFIQLSFDRWYRQQGNDVNKQIMVIHQGTLK